MTAWGQSSRSLLLPRALGSTFSALMRMSFTSEATRSAFVCANVGNESARLSANTALRKVLGKGFTEVEFGMEWRCMGASRSDMIHCACESRINSEPRSNER